MSSTFHRTRSGPPTGTHERRAPSAFEQADALARIGEWALCYSVQLSYQERKEAAQLLAESLATSPKDAVDLTLLARHVTVKSNTDPNNGAPAAPQGDAT